MHRQQRRPVSQYRTHPARDPCRARYPDGPGDATADDYTNFILACLTHDSGYVRGIVQGDDGDSFVADLSGRTIRLTRGSSDAALGPYHVDRSKLFVFERLDPTEEVDASRIAKAI